MNLADGPAEQARLRPDAPAIEDGARTITYAELDRRVNAAAHRLVTQGVQPGDFVGIMLPDGAEFLILVLALGRVGAVVVSVNEALSEAERRNAVADLDVRKVVARTSAAPFEGAAALPIETICEDRVDAVQPIAAPDLPPGHPATARQSSGTTGRPKTVLWSHDFMVGRLPLLQQRQGWSPADRYLQVVRMTFSYSRDQCVFFLHFGGTVVINRSKSPAELARNIRDGGITYVSFTPTHLRALLQVESESYPLFPKLRAMHSTSAVLTVAERQAVEERLSPNLQNGYGTNECGLISMAGPEERAAYPKSVGTITPGVEAKILDRSGRELPPGEVGLLGMRSQGMPTSYYRNEEASKRHFVDGWFYPGDLASINEDGYVFFRGRADDVINNEGTKFYPIEVEQVLREHPAIEEAAVLGWPHARHGQVAIACCVCTERLTLDQVQDFCLESLPAFKLPGLLLLLKSLPKTQSGKVRKGELREKLKKHLDPVLS